MAVDELSARKRSEKMAGVINGLLNPLLLCAFLPILEGKPGIDFSSVQGFCGQLVVAVVLAEVIGSLPIFERSIHAAVAHFGLDEKPAGKLLGVVVGATLLFGIIGLGECVLTGGVGDVEGRGLFVRWASLMCTGWGFVVVSGLLIDPIACRLARAIVARAPRTLVFWLPPSDLS